MPAPSRGRSTALGKGKGCGYDRCRGRFCVHLLQYLSIHIEPAPPHLFTLGVVRFGRRTQLVGYDAVRLAIEQECHRHKALLLKDPSPQIKLVVLPATILPRLPRVSLVQWHIAIPDPVSVLAGELADA